MKIDTATFLYLFNSQLSIFNILCCADTKRQANTFCRSIDVASQTRYFIVTHIRRSAAMTHEVTGRHPAQALRRCATTPEESLSAPGEREDVRSADAILHSNPHSWERSDDAWGLWPPHCPCASEMRYYARGVTLCTRRTRGCPQRGHAFS